MARVFHGKNWKLASPNKWIEAKVSLLNKVGLVTLDGKEFDVFAVDGGFAAVPKAKDKEREPKYYVPRVRWIVNCNGGNRHTSVRGENLEEALENFQSLMKKWNTFGTLHRQDVDGTITKVATGGGKNVQRE